MLVRRLSLSNFRPFERKVFELMPGLNIFHGANAQGKTSILEAVFTCSIGQSFRTAQLTETIRRNTPGFCVELAYEKCGITQELKLCGTPSERYVLMNGQKQPLNSLYGGLTAVASTPEDVQLIKGPPSLRREYLDRQLLQIDPLYGHHLKRYNRALKQRNALLRMQSKETLESWEYELAHSAAFLMLRRKKAIENLSPKCRHLYTHLCGIDTQLTLKYRPGISLHIQNENNEEWKEKLRNMWKSQRERDIATGTTLSGPHKDDFHVVLNQLETRNYGSEGEQRTAALSLRLAEWQLILDGNDGEKPLLLVDDLGYGLDTTRQKNLIHWLQNAGQILLTTTDPMTYIESATHWHIRQG